MFTFFTITQDFFRRQNGAVLTETLQRLYENCTVIEQSNDISSKIARCPCDVNAGSLRLSQEPTIILLSKFVWCPHDQHAVPVRGSCDQPAMYLRDTGLRFFQNLSECGVNKIVDATTPVNSYDDDWVSLR